jgi:hypothetical protein
MAKGTHLAVMLLLPAYKNNNTADGSKEGVEG